MKLETTKNYGLFITNSEQRPIINRHAKLIAESMTAFGFIPSKPIQCYRKNGRLVVVDGHHRLEAAKSIGCAVYYIAEDNASQKTMAAENTLVKPWSGSDYVRLYAARGAEGYMMLQKYRELGIPVGMAASMMINNSASSCNATRAIKEGTFKIRSLDHIESVADIIRDYGSFSSAVSSRPFIAAISKCIMCDKFNLDTFRGRLTENISMLIKTSNEDQMLSVIESIYNHRSRSPIPIKFHVQASAKERNFKNLKNQ